MDEVPTKPTAAQSTELKPAGMVQPWNQGIRGEQVLPLINSDADTIRCVAGPGTGKTFGLVRRVERILHPAGLAADGRDVLVVAFNRVIARQLREDIEARLKTFDHKHAPVIRTIHALCVEVIGEELRMLLSHEVDAMLYDVLHLHPAIAKQYKNFHDAQQALRDHEAGHKEHLELWQGARQWLVRHKAHLVSDLPRLLLARLKGGDFPEKGFDFVIVDEFQDLTAGEQELIFRLRRPGGQLVVLGDPRQSIYTFRGNDRQGLAKLEALVGEGNRVTDVPITECQRCPKPIVVAANKLMALSGVDAMVPVSETKANIHVVTWKTPEAEAAGMAKAIVENIHAHPEDRHLVMVTRRQFGYWLRDHIAELDPKLRLDLVFSEGLLDSWAAREAFLMFCLLIDPDRPTWRAWLGYKNSMTGKDFTPPKRNADAYVQLLKSANDAITVNVVEALAAEERGKSRGKGGIIIWDRAKRFIDLREKFEWNGEDAAALVKTFFNSQHWIGDHYETEKREGAVLDLQLLQEKTLVLLAQEQERKPEDVPVQHLQRVIERLRHQIATNEALTTDQPTDLQVATLWGAKGVTAEHVYLLGVCREAIPGERRQEYPGTEIDYIEEQRRLFYVSITRPKRTLVLSLALKVKRGPARQMGLKVASGDAFWANLRMSPFLEDILALLPDAVAGESWSGCVSK
jgi:DNA helicase II / ATP-dependent DNA helicase PcrA